jgi:glycosyltransferase involved in cell wall biosynthesis
MENQLMILKKFQNRLDLQFFTSSKRDVSLQRNLGAKKAKAPFLVFFDADTQIPSDFILELKTAFDNRKGDLVNTYIKSDSIRESEKTLAKGINLLFNFTKIIGVPTAFGSMIAIRKDVFGKLGGFNSQFGEDTALVVSAVKKGFKYILLQNTYYLFSFRRYRKEGTLKTISQALSLNLKNWSNVNKAKNNIDYLMGGHLFDNDGKKQSLKWLKRVFRNIKEG